MSRIEEAALARRRPLAQVVAGTSVAHRVERLVLPLRDLFAAMFLFAFGLSVDPGALTSVCLLYTSPSPRD